MIQAKPHELQCILDSIADGVFTVDKDWNITRFNKAAERITGVPCEEAIGQQCCDVFRANLCECGCALRDTLRTGQPTINKAIEIMSAQGKPIPVSISTAMLQDETGKIIGGVETFRDLTTVEELRKRLKGEYTFYDIISRNHKMRELFTLLPKIAESNSTCLIQGESGTGKELIVRAIHSLSPRKDKPFIAVNCGALPDTLLESELFGYEKGAFTDATKDKAGRFELAEGGVLFLDEIGDISGALQVKLLRVLQEKEYDVLGATISRKADVRVIAATNKNLSELVQTGDFRSDLFYRINVVQINVPPLRERKEDIPILVEHFINRLNRLQGKDVAGLSQESLITFMNHDWPGNVRELENAIESAFVLCSAGMILPKHLPQQFKCSSAGPDSSVLKTLEEMEMCTIQETLKHNNYNRQKTATQLGINKTTLWRKINKYGIELPA
jgi:PAS domain S-box-containing protein